MDARIPTTDLARRGGCLAGSLVAVLACMLPADGSTQPVSSSAQPARSPELARQIELALADAVARSGIGPAEVKVDSAEPVTWADGSLGCPAADLMYTQALVPGYRIRIVAGDQRLDYHADTRGEMLLCPAERAKDPLRARR